MTAAQRCRDCARVRQPSEPSALTWVHDRRPDGAVSWLCERCAREHLRSIEARLSEDYW